MTPVLRIYNRAGRVSSVEEKRSACRTQEKSDHCLINMNSDRLSLTLETTKYLEENITLLLTFLLLLFFFVLDYNTKNRRSKNKDIAVVSRKALK